MAGMSYHRNRRFFALGALFFGAIAVAGLGGAPRTPVVSVFEGRVETVQRLSSSGWQISIRLLAPSATSGIVLIYVDSARSVIRDRSGAQRSLPGVRSGDSVTAWVHGAVQLSDPAFAFAESLLVRR